jgi:polyhydroxyalkanoate synthesis regulator phasin
MEQPDLVSQIEQYHESLAEGMRSFQQAETPWDRVQVLSEIVGAPLGVDFLKKGLKKKWGFGEEGGDSDLKSTLDTLKDVVKSKLPGAEGEEGAEGAMEGLSGLVSKAKDKVNELASKVGDYANETAETARDYVGGLQGEAEEALGQVQSHVSSAVGDAREAVAQARGEFMPQIPEELNSQISDLQGQLQEAKDQFNALDLFDQGPESLELQGRIADLTDRLHANRFFKDDLISSQRAEFESAPMEELGDRLSGLSDTASEVASAFNQAGESVTASAMGGLESFASRLHGFASGDFSTLARALNLGQQQEQAEEAEESPAATVEAERSASTEATGEGESVAEEAADASRASEAVVGEAAGEEVGGEVAGEVAGEAAAAALAPETGGLSEIIFGLATLGASIGTLFHKDKTPEAPVIPAMNPTYSFGF